MTKKNILLPFVPKITIHQLIGLLILALSSAANAADLISGVDYNLGNGRGAPVAEGVAGYAHKGEALDHFTKRRVKAIIELYRMELLSKGKSSKIEPQLDVVERLLMGNHASLSMHPGYTLGAGEEVRFLTQSGLEKCQVFLINHKFYHYDQKGTLVLYESGDEALNGVTGDIIVMDPQGNIFIQPKIMGFIHHSSFFSQKAIAFGAMVRVKNGELVKPDNTKDDLTNVEIFPKRDGSDYPRGLMYYSGHYDPHTGTDQIKKAVKVEALASFKKELDILHFDIDGDSPFGFTKLTNAIASNTLPMVINLVGNGSDLEEPIMGGRTPLNIAASLGYLDIVKFLVGQGANKEAYDINGRTPLLCASKEGHLDVVKYLVAQGAELTKVNNAGWTPLNSASDGGYLEVVKYLAAQGVSTEATGDGFTPLNSSSSNGHLGVVEYLVSQKVNIETANDTGFTPLNSAAYGGHLDVVKYLIAQGANKETASNKKWTPLNSASDKGHVEIVQYLVDEGANKEAANVDGFTPLHIAAGRGHFDIVKYLVDHGANKDTTCKDGYTPLNSAAFAGHLDIVKYLVENGASIETATNDGFTPLNTASVMGHLEVVKFLVSKGANKDTATKLGGTPLIHATMLGHQQIEKFLTDRGAYYSKWYILNWFYGIGIKGAAEKLRSTQPDLPIWKIHSN